MFVNIQLLSLFFFCLFIRVIRRLLSDMFTIKDAKYSYCTMFKNGLPPITNDCPMTLSLVLFLVGVLGFSLNRRSLLMLLVSIELMLLAVTLLVLTTANSYGDAAGMTFSIIIIATAGAESAIGLGVLVAYYRLRGTLSLSSPRL